MSLGRTATRIYTLALRAFPPGHRADYAIAVRQSRLEEDDVRNSGEPHVFKCSIYSNVVSVLTCDQGMVGPSDPFAPGIARISERFLIVRKSIAR